jgi:glycosyltransferase involved in cell wall biosynthesis
MPTLFVFTYNYPFGAGEEFLETEIEYLQERFDCVVLVPELQPGPPRRLPKGVDCDDWIARRTKSLLQRSVRYPQRMFSVTAARELFGRHGPRHPLNIIRLAIHLDRASLVRRWLIRQMRQGRFEADRAVFYCYWLLSAAYAIGQIKRRTPGLRLVARAHSGDLYREAYYPVQREALSGLDFVFPISQFARDFIARGYPEKRSTTEIARLGSRRPGKLASRSQDGTLRLLSCSNIIEVKRLDLLIESLVELARGKPEMRVRWTHLGDGPLAGRIRVLASRKLDGTNVSWEFRGRLTHEQVFGYYASEPVDLLLNTSRSEGVPVSMMEAQSHGVPIVATDVGAVREIVSPETGVLFPASPSPSQVADAIAEAASDGERLTRWRRGARRNWEERFDAEKNYRAFAAKLAEMCDAV